MASTDDTNQTSVYIPLQESGADNIESYSLFPGRDLPNGYELRLSAYKTAWSKCLERVQELIHALHVPIVDRVVALIDKAYKDTLPGLPCPEVPVISVTGASPSIFDDISTRLGAEGQDGLFDDSTGTHIVTHLFPQDCPNLTSAMKTMITNFIRETEEELGMCAWCFLTCPPSDGFLDSVKRKPPSSLSTIDMNLLQIWFNALCESRGSDSNTTRLVVIMHDFEQVDPLIMQDLFEISSLAVPRLPLVFILSIITPSTPSYLHATYPRSTLSRLQVRSCSFSTNHDVLHDILLGTFFDIEFDPRLVLGPGTIEFLVDFFGRHSPSLDSLVSTLQLAHMKHFEEPLTVFSAEAALMARNLTDPDSAPFLDCALARVQTSTLVPRCSVGWPAGGVPELLELIQTARLTFQRESKLLRVSFRVFLAVQTFMVSLGFKSEKTLPELMCMALRGRLGTSYRYLCTLVEKLHANQLDDLLSDLHDLFTGFPVHVRDAEEEIISRINTACLVHGRHSDGQEEVRNVAETVGNWLLDYFQHRFVTLEELPLWDIWYTGSTVFPSELVNPSLRASIFSGLLYPQDYGAIVPSNENVADDENTNIWIPDTCILFQRYLESGRMINVFDWFESFMVVLEAQKQHVTVAPKASIRTPTRRKGKQRQEEAVEESEEQHEKWRLEAQARFIRSLHELDYIGLIKHTSRKADHVMRTVFDIMG